MYENITKYYRKFDGAGACITDRQGDGSAERPFQFPFVEYSEITKSFISDMQTFVVYNYREVLSRNGIEWGFKSMQSADISALDTDGLLALITGAIRAERFCDGALKNFIESGCLDAWLLRLRELDRGE